MNIVLSVKLPEELRDKLDVLAKLEDITRNRLVVKTLSNATKGIELSKDKNNAK